MVRLLSAFGCGAFFAVGLAVAGMTRPSKVIDFLNITRDWDPSLMFVLGGAVTVYAVLRPLVLKRPKAVLGQPFSRPSFTKVDARLILGAVLFGIGWGLSGICPGPGITSLFTGNTYILVFVLTMSIGMITAHVFLSQMAKSKR